MDAATIKGVVDRLRDKGLVASRRDTDDKRRLLLEASPQGQALFRSLCKTALRITDETLEPLAPEERDTFLALLERLG